MRWITNGLIVILFAYLGLIVYANRALFTSQFDQKYWQDRFEHSQWSLPISQRIIGDDGLYLYEANRLIRGGDPTTSDAEVPPFGKYLIGASIILFGNGYFYGLLSVTILLVGIYILAKKLTHHTNAALLITLLTATDPLITAQATLTMLDILQGVALVWLLIFLFSIPRFKQKYQTAIAVTAGVALGLFSETKFPILTPVIGLISLWYLWTTTKKSHLIVLFATGGVIGYLLPYAVYFTQGHTLIEWLRVQKWILSFYHASAITPTWGSAFATLLIGKYQDIISRDWRTASEWSPVWGLFFIASVSTFVTSFFAKQKNKQVIIISLSVLASIGIFAVTPFWVRYLVVILPLLYLIGGYIIFKLPRALTVIIVGILLCINASVSIRALFPTPEDTIRQYIYNTEHLFFSDIYEDTTTEFKKTHTRDAFNHFGLMTMKDGEIEAIRIYPITTAYSHTSPQNISLKVTYYTRRLGSFIQRIDVPFVLEQNRWRVPWQWSYLLPELSESARLVTSVMPAKRGTILTGDGKPLASDETGHMVWVTPGGVRTPDEKRIFSFLETVFHKRMPAVAIEHRIVGNTVPDIPVPIGAISDELDGKYTKALMAFSPITLTDTFTRVYHPRDSTDIGVLKNSAFTECCSYLYSTTTYDGISGVEKIYNSTLKGFDGGTLILKTPDGETLATFINIKKKDGHNIQL